MEQIEAEEHELLVAMNFDFDLVDNLPYGAIMSFCKTYGNPVSMDQVLSTAITFCNDSFKLPLCLHYHPKVIAAACIQSAMLFRL